MPSQILTEQPRVFIRIIRGCVHSIEKEIPEKIRGIIKKMGATGLRCAFYGPPLPVLERKPVGQ